MILYKSQRRASLMPNKIAFTDDVVAFDVITGEIFKPKRQGEKPKVEKKFHNFEISQNAQKTIKEKITWLYQLSKSKSVTTQKGKLIFNHKMSFITLTLPSAQSHPTAEITKECFNQFLVEIRKEYVFENYVWRLEFQKNGNVHYHIATDVFIDYERIREVWNRCLEKKGYVSAYRQKMSSLSLADYLRLYRGSSSCSEKELAQRYFKGKNSEWAQPPSVDVKSCTSGKSIAHYIGKYFGKYEKSGTKKNELDNEDNSFALRLWFCSRSLSKLKSVVEWIDNWDCNFHYRLSEIDKIVKKVYQYAEVIYFDFKNLTNENKGIFSQIFRKYANSLGYSSA